MFQGHRVAGSSTSTASAFQPSNDQPQRESRIHSIYEKYLYDPKDLQSTDPVIRQLARKHSQRQQHNRMPSAAKKRQSAVGFAQGTKGDGPSSNANANGKPRNSTGSAYEGFGALMDEYSDSDDSDNEAPRPDRAGASQQRGAVRESWSARAQAVGERPPDSASQNPPTLKLLGLKSQREGGQPLGRPNNGPATLVSPSYQRERAPSPAFEMLSEVNEPRAQPVARHGINEQSVSEYGDGGSRVGSTIDFTGQGSDGFGGAPVVQSQVPPQSQSRQMQQQQPARGPVSPPRAVNNGLQPSSASNPRKALTAQLGLDTPLPSKPASPSNGPQGDYFSARGNGGNHEVELSRDDPFNTTPRSPQAAMVRGPPSSSSSFGASSPTEKTNPFGSGDSPPGRMLVAGPGPQGYGPRSPTSPMRPEAPLIAQQQGYNRGPPQPILRNGNDVSPMAMPRPQPAPGPGFSQQAPPQKRQSVFRRSMAFVTGGGGEPSWQQQQQQQQQQQGYQQGPGGNKRQSIFRRSMAFLSGKPAPAPAPAPEPLEENHAPPRNRGFDNEKEMISRRSQYLGGGHKGDEWDVNGAGANFWRRFNEAQRHANPNDKMEMTSRRYTEKAITRRKLSLWLSGLGGVLIIAAVIGIVIWREGKASNDNGNPGSINKGDFGGTHIMQRSEPTPVAAVVAARESVERDDNGDVWATARVVEERAHPLPRSTAVPQLSKRQIMRRHAQRHAIRDE
ncbi:hypothetical protein BDZ90DRAFT_273571 [Jaminaea rosea]|uniref:Uncharacterized protein n=1 Tax=Jaminaea rosea TaxID=1569628 RepID=A0A316UWI3_9BASI|nr:hypothetical protein BDZ90DRAFT_273571 [Jaminaea rosea]PWN29667.1 hypothetical protein BDZ90DRAFT_273571 [Jaminaea rosea]